VTAIEEITQELDAAVAAEMPKIPEVWSCCGCDFGRT
jgi:hypothetical protein